MVTMSIGSIANNIQNRIDSIPTTISGTVLIGIVDEERLYVEEYSGFSIGSVAIAEKYQPAITSLATARLLDMMQTIGADVNSVTLGEFSVSKGEGSNISSSAKMFREDGMRKLQSLGKTSRFMQVIG